jgi:hypothetical protein
MKIINLIAAVCSIVSIPLSVILAYVLTTENDQHKVIAVTLAVCVVVMCAALCLAYYHIYTASNVNTKRDKLKDFRNPEWETVVGKSFKNEEIILDKKRFWNCTFDNVTLRFNGEGPVEFMGGCNFAPNMILASNSPVAMEYANLIEILRSIPNTVAKHVSVDKDGRPLKATFQIREVTPDKKPSEIKDGQ